MIINKNLFLKELRVKMRGKSIFIIENVYLLLIAVLIVGFVNFQRFFSPYETPTGGWEYGISLFKNIAFLQAALLIVVTPSFLASSITLEKEEKTWDLLLTTPLTMKEIVWTKFIASISPFLILLFVSLPIFSSVFIMGGVSPKEVLAVYLTTILGIFVAGSFGFYCSSYFNKTFASVPISIIATLIFLLIINLPFFSLISFVSPFVCIKNVLSDWKVEFFKTNLSFWIINLILSVEIFALSMSGTFNRLRILRKDINSQRILGFILYTTLLTFAFAKFSENQEKFVNFFLLHAISALIILPSIYQYAIERKSLKFFEMWLPYSIIFFLTGYLIYVITRISGIIEFKKDLIVLKIFIPLFSSTLFFSILTQRLAKSKVLRGRLKTSQIVYFLIFLFVFLPLILSKISNRNYLELLLVLTPISSFNYILSPKNFLHQFPSLENIPFTIITPLIYFILSLFIFPYKRRAHKGVK